MKKIGGILLQFVVMFWNIFCFDAHAQKGDENKHGRQAECQAVK